MINERIGKFVTREHVAFTYGEIQSIIANIEKQIEGNKFGIKYATSYVEDNSLHTLVIKLKMPHYVGRDADKARFDIKGISFVIWKAKGELEVDWKNGIYDKFDGVCYSGDICFDAKWCRYRGQHFEGYQKVCPYAYGDEITDLNYTKVLNQLYKDLQNCKKI